MTPDEHKAAAEEALAATHPDQHADWHVQTGHVQWEEA